MRTNVRGFTLIGLLIVIAIIAILALIAIPNFLEAQVRARVSRCYADIRSLALAVEAYTVDYATWTRSSTRLTSPIAYISSLPLDPFTLRAGGLNKQGAGVHRNKPFEYLWTGPERSSGAWGNCYKAGFYWWFYTYGPSRNCQDSSDPTSNINTQAVLLDKSGQGSYIYDATNGTISRGYIIWTNKGLFTSRDPG